MIYDARSPAVCRNVVPEPHPSLICNIHIKGIEALSMYCACPNIDNSLPVTAPMLHKVPF